MPRAAASGTTAGRTGSVGPVSLLYEEAPEGARSNPYKVPDSGDLRKLARAVAKGEGLRGGVDIVFCSDEKVRALNKAYRKLDKVTDVLSFEWHEEDFAGEVYIAVDQVKRQAPRFNNNYFNELRRVVVHGVLHLCGHDHMKAGERRVMREREDHYLGLAASGPEPRSGRRAKAAPTAAPGTPTTRRSGPAASPRVASRGRV